MSCAARDGSCVKREMVESGKEPKWENRDEMSLDASPRPVEGEDCWNPSHDEVIEWRWEQRLTSHRQDLMSSKYPLRDRLKLLDATVTPSLLYASGTWTMTEETKKKTDDEDDHTDKETNS